jgi:nucleoside-diphosphate-sugar epimerase
MKIAVTGGTGFVGKNLIPYLGGISHDIRSIGRSELVVINADTIDDCDVFIHLAGKAHDLKNVANPNAYYDTNFELSKKLYEVFLQSNATKFIFISSVKAAADTVADMLSEDTPPDPQTHYGKSKLMAEQYIQAQPVLEGKSFYILRPCMIHGPGNKGNLNLLYQLVKKGVPYPLAAFENKRSYLSVENLCFIIKELIAQHIPSGVYQVADDKPLSTTEVFSLLAQATHKSPRLWNIPKKLVKWIALVGDKINLPLNSEKLDKLTDNYIVSNQKIMSALNQPLPLTSEAGLLITARSFNQNPKP